MIGTPPLPPPAPASGARAASRGSRRRLAGLVSASLLALVAGESFAAGYRTRETDVAIGRYAPPYRDPPDGLIVVSYNIAFGENIEAALADLRAEPDLSRADILLLQEMDPEGCYRIARELRCDFVYYPASIHPRHGRPFGNAVMTRGRVVRHGFISLPTLGPLSGTPRVAVFADLEIGGRRVRAVSVHASTVVVPAPERRRQHRAVLDSLASVPGALIIGGDFNTAGGSDATRLVGEMRRGGLHAAPVGGGPTVRSGWLGVLGIEGRLDHIFFRGLAMRRAGIGRRGTAGDHFPVWAVLGWPNVMRAPSPAHLP